MPRGQELRAVDPVLTELLRGYTNEEFVGKNLFPIVNVPKEAGKIPSFGKEAFRLYSTERALRAHSNRLPVEARTTIDFATTEQDAVYPLDYREPQEDIINTEKYGAYLAQSAIELKHEYACASLATTLGNYATANKITLAGSSQFTHADSDPIATVSAGKEAVRKLIVKEPNVGVIGAATLYALKNNAKIKDSIKYSQKPIVTIDLLKELFDLKALYVGRAVYLNDAGAVVDIWGDNFVLAYVPEAKSSVERSVYEPSYGYTIRKNGMPEADTFMEEGGKIKNVRSTDNFVVKLTGAEAGYLINDTNA